MSERINKTDIILLALIGVVFILAAIYIRYPHDDAFISFRYSRNLAHGMGFVYNPGGERVEGYTDFLWVLLITQAFFIGVAPMVFARILGLASGLGIIVTVYFFARSVLKESRAAPVIAALAIGTNLSIVSWSVNGLETDLFGLLVLLAVFTYYRGLEKGGSGALWGIIAGLAALTRPEGWFLPGAFWTFEILGRLILKKEFSKAGDRPFKLLLAGTATFALIFVPYFIWRYVYFGYPLPNSVYAKVGINFHGIYRGLKYTGSFINRYNLFFVLFIPSLLAWKKLWNREWLTLAWFFSIWIGHATLVGGDHMSFYRFLVPGLPFAVLAGGKVFYWNVEARGKLFRYAALIIVLGLWWMPWMNKRIYYDIAWNRKHMPAWIVAGKALKKYAKPGETLAVTTAGAIPYYSDLNTIDMLGLNNIYIAHQPSEHKGIGTAGHEKGDAKYTMSLKPDYVVFFPWITKNPQRDFNASLKLAMAWVERDLAKMPEFRENYYVVAVPMEDGRYFNLYKRKK